MRLYVGTNFGHGAAVAALDDAGDLTYAVEEGRLTGHKDCDQFPEQALRFLLNRYRPKDLHWAEGWNLWQRFMRKGLVSTIRYGFGDRSYFRSRLLKETNRFCNALISRYEWRHVLPSPVFVGHHLAHAYSLLPWGLPNKSLVVVSDTTSESAAVTFFYWSGSSMVMLAAVPFPHSPGAAFHQMAYHLGFSGRTAPGKLMALAGLGRPLWFHELKSICGITKLGFRFDLSRYPAWRRMDAWQRFATASASTSLKKEIIENFGRGEEGHNLASSVQEWFTATTIDIIKDALNIARCRGLDVRHLGLAGGAALNCQTNGFIRRALRDLRIQSATISPWSDDPGTAIGAAAWLFHKTTGKLPGVTPHPFLGPPASSCVPSGKVSELDVRKSAEVLTRGGIVALVSGSLEFGPRALGGRCLLGDPRSNHVRDRLNAIKGRPPFMPLAPVVLEQDCATYFLDKGSKNMAWTVRSNPYAFATIPGAIHVNGDVRLQVLQEDPTTLLWRVLSMFRSLTGVGALLLTSLNGKDQPIAVDMRTAAGMATRMGLAGIISDEGWYEPEKVVGRTSNKNSGLA